MSVGNKTALNMVKERKQTKHVDHWIKVNKNEWSLFLVCFVTCLVCCYYKCTDMLVSNYSTNTCLDKPT